MAEEFVLETCLICGWTGCDTKHSCDEKTLEFIRKAREIHGWLPDYSKVEYIRETKPVVIIEGDEEFEMTPDECLNGTRCIVCEGVFERDGEDDRCLECRSKKRRYDLDFLRSFCRVKKLELVGEYEKVKRETRIRGKCLWCGEEFEKAFRCMIERGGSLCEPCQKKHRTFKTGKTNIRKYGVPHQMYSESIKGKIKQTNLKKYGVENPFQSESIKKKIKQTNLKKYGVENPSSLEEIKERMRQTNMERRGVNYPQQSEDVKERGKETCLLKYGVEYCLQSEEVREKSKETCLVKYGVKYATQSEKVKEKAKVTNLERYGTENAMQSEQVKEKARVTNLERYGVEYSTQSEQVKEKVRVTNLERYQVVCTLHSKEGREKTKKTNLARYGFPNAMQNPQILEKAQKSAYSLKPYTLPSDDIIYLQGYEHFALDDLLEEGYSEYDIVTGCQNVPKIAYKDEDGKDHIHFPDIFIPPENLCIEVKSAWTFEVKEDSVLLKQESAKRQGFAYQIWVYDAKGEKSVVE